MRLCARGAELLLTPTCSGPCARAAWFNAAGSESFGGNLVVDLPVAGLSGTCHRTARTAVAYTPEFLCYSAPLRRGFSFGRRVRPRWQHSLRVGGGSDGPCRLS